MMHGQATRARGGVAAATPLMSDPLHSLGLCRSSPQGGAALQSTPPWGMGPTTTPLHGQARVLAGQNPSDTRP